MFEYTKKALVQNHPNIAKTYTNMANAYAKLSDTKKANEYQEKADVIKQYYLQNIF